jgi:uncharacterized protein with LGFP repeats
MARQRKRFGHISRTALGIVLAAAAVGFFAPTAVASPESDATDAINAAWDAAGGDGSTLGPRDGGVYPVGEGYAQNFAGGAIFYSPATGAKIMHGAILDKYRDLGGPADSDLGFPDIDEGPGRISPESRNSTFNAGDKPVIFWTPETGAWVVRGAINAAWDRLGGSAGVLGVPVADETYSGDVVSQRFTGGAITYDMRAKTFTTEPPDLVAQLEGLEIPYDAASAIAAAWRANGGATGALGVKAGQQYAIGDDGAGQDFAGGKVFFTPETGAYAVTGDILTKYESVGGPTGDFGFPVGSETDGGVPDSRVQVFSASDNPTVFWTKDHGAVIVRGAMKAAWDKLGGATGALGVPVKDQNTEGAVVTQEFSGGTLSWNSQDNTFTSDPANLAQSLEGLEVPEAPIPSAPPEAPATEDDGGFTWQNWWLWWIIPLALLLLGSLYAAWFAVNRRRSAAHADYDEDDPGYEKPAFDTSAYDKPAYDKPGYDTDYEKAYEADYEKRFSPAGDEAEGWSPRQEYGDHDHDHEDEHEGYLPPSPSWGGEPERTSSYDDEGLFTHRGAHEAEDGGDADEDDFDADTAPTRVLPAVDDSTQAFGRHAAKDADEPATWTAPPEDDDYLPGPGSLFAPVYGAAPPPARSLTGYDPRYDEYGSAGYESPERTPADDMAYDAVIEEAEADDLADDAADGHWDEASAVEAVDDAPEQAESTPPPAIHLPLDDPYTAPEGYPVKGSMRTGRYYVPGAPGYDEIAAEIWFTGPETAEANGFSRAD